MSQVLVTRLDPEVPLPYYARPGDAGADLVAAEDVHLAPGERATVGPGSRSRCPTGTRRSCTRGPGWPPGTASRWSMRQARSTSGYRGEIKVILLNTDPARPVTFRRGDRIAQLVVQRVEHATFREVAALPGSVRGEGGFGSTGGHAGGVSASAPAGE